MDAETLRKLTKELREENVRLLAVEQAAKKVLHCHHRDCTCGTCSLCELYIALEALKHKS